MKNLLLLRFEIKNIPCLFADTNFSFTEDLLTAGKLFNCYSTEVFNHNFNIQPYFLYYYLP